MDQSWLHSMSKPTRDIMVAVRKHLCARCEVQTHYEPANQAMKRRDFLKVTGCTAQGGLSITPTSQAIEQRLAAKKAAPCGSGCACH
jgi:hypothetical protein